VEEHLQKNGTVILKFFLHISEKVQKNKIEKCLADPEKKWKYTANDTAEVKKWDNYVSAYQQVVDGCGKHNPWVIVPADQKWYRNHLVANTIVETLEKLKMKFPK
jgi:polyphosphate kinase 2 (PPK2 family)